MMAATVRKAWLSATAVVSANSMTQTVRGVCGGRGVDSAKCGSSVLCAAKSLGAGGKACSPALTIYFSHE
jgi:hypothetical protein